MRLRTTTVIVLTAVAALAIPVAAYAAIPFFGPILPDQTCPGGWGMLMQVINNIISVVLTIAIVFVAPIMVAWAGFYFVTSPTNPSGKEKGKAILTNTVIGIIIALAAWMIVDALLSLLTTGSLASWTSLITGGDYCLDQAGIGGNMGVSGQQGTQPTVTTSSSSGGPTITTVGPNGQAVTVSFAPTQNLSAGYTAASAYSAQIASACSGSTIPNCTTVVTSVIAAESGGRPSTGCNSSTACGIMQLTQANGGADCAATDTACIGSQITKGVQLLQAGYNKFPNIPNALAAYNSGVSTTAGTSASGLNGAMVASVNCPGSYAWQCSTNPGGLVETQNYVANICQSITSHGGTC